MTNEFCCVFLSLTVVEQNLDCLLLGDCSHVIVVVDLLLCRVDVCLNGNLKPLVNLGRVFADLYQFTGSFERFSVREKPPL